MNKTLLTAVCAGALLIGAGISKANDMPPPPPPGHEMPMHHDMGPKKHGPKEFGPELRKEHAERFAKDLGLTEEQTAQAEKIREDGRKKMEPLMKEMKELREKMDKVRKNNMEEFEKILTKEQKEKLEAKKAEGHKKFKKDRKHKKGGDDRKDGKDRKVPKKEAK